MAQIVLAEGAAPSTPSSGNATMYVKTDGLFYGKDDAGTETQLSNAAAITMGSPTATTSGTSIDYTSLPTGIKKIIISFVGVSTTGTSIPIVQLGDSGGVETSGYSGAVTLLAAATMATANISSAGFNLCNSSHAAASVYHGQMTLTLQDSSTNTWAASAVLGQSDTTRAVVMGGSKSLSSTLDRIRLTTVGGTETFDAGAINITYL